MDELLTRGVEDIISRTELEQALAKSQKLRLKLGVDPSSPDIHLGHAVVLRKLRQLQELGHTVIFLIGDATGRIGDPSGRNQTRPVLTETEITANAQTYLDQVGSIIDLDRAEVRRNSEWLDKLSFSDLIKLAGQFSVAQLLERDDFKQRLDAGAELGLHELLYPLMQAYDSVMLEADVEFGGNDQLFNMMAGRALQKKMGHRPQQVFLSKLLVGTDGVRKMSKSYGNYIGVSESPAEMYGKVMSIPDALIAPYYELCTNIEPDVINELVKTLAEGANPRDAKASLAREIVTLYHSADAALDAEAAFNRKHGNGEVTTEDMTEYRLGQPTDLVQLLVELNAASSNSEARRLIEQGGVRLNGTVQAASVIVSSGDRLQVGKRRYYRIV